MALVNLIQSFGFGTLYAKDLRGTRRVFSHALIHSGPDELITCGKASRRGRAVAVARYTDASHCESYSTWFLSGAWRTITAGHSAMVRGNVEATKEAKHLLDQLYTHGRTMQTDGRLVVSQNSGLTTVGYPERRARMNAGCSLLETAVLCEKNTLLSSSFVSHETGRGGTADGPNYRRAACTVLPILGNLNFSVVWQSPRLVSRGFRALLRRIARGIGYKPIPSRKQSPPLLPTLVTSFEEDLGQRRASLPTLGISRSYSGAQRYSPTGIGPHSSISHSSGSAYSFPPTSAGPFDGLNSSSSDDWIARPSSTPLRHTSFSSTMRISGQRPSNSNKDWPYPSPHQQSSVHNSEQPTLPSLPVPSPGSDPSPSATSGDQRPTRKRGKLPKETTDFLKAWLHRHSDHPYPSEDEKKQLCHATGLSMSQVSNWMINARRRILAPARPHSGPTTTTPYPQAPPSTGGGPVRRTSLPMGSSPYDPGLQLYHSMSLQSYPHAYPQQRSHTTHSTPLPYNHNPYPPEQPYLDGPSYPSY
ncbi:hypothetical protein CYLTODRAFT_441111 [Cylindrobasidium torrendii FP15055 ss-10]|uniref:Homeobox domain-containing protein n=1 Tax=Cylindrobasidium torrendii FP15055 ss-10 TaxID=1314674 RepID=A0A0D7BNK4_9AGAR|nr:hypothetical protein CYLTODRAFT_441111 [Cylindrobasidium torrendii FP15055 ss-10]